MDAILEPLWRAGEKPFHGTTIFPTENVYVRDAVVAMSSAYDHIALYYPSARLFALEDWHEHDGYISPSKPTSLAELREQVGSPESYVRSHSDDSAVYRAIYPESLDFVLRYCLWDDDSAGSADREVQWSFTGYGHAIPELRKRWQQFSLSEEPSAEYFQSRYAG
jgi:hypothetical protein